MPARGRRTSGGERRTGRARPPAGAAQPEGRYIVPGLKRGLEILELFRKDRSVLRLSDMASELGLSRSTAFRLAYTLEALGFLERGDDAKSYRLASRVLRLGFEYLSSMDVVAIARPVLERLRDRTGVSAHLAVLERREIVHLVRVPGHGGMTSNVSVGLRRPAHATPMGRILLFDLADEQLAKLYRGVTLTRVTDQTPTSLAALRSLLAADRARGYVVSHGTYVPGGSSIAAPVRGPDGGIVAAINISGPHEAFDDQAVRRMTGAVLEAAEEISLRLGYTAPRGGREPA